MAGRGQIRKFPIAPVFRALGGECNDYSSGRQKVRCPFHGDTRPSASIDFTKQRFTCFACGVGGDALDLVIGQEGLSWDAAVARCESICGGEAPAVRERGEPAAALFDRPRAGRRGP